MADGATDNTISAEAGAILQALSDAKPGRTIDISFKKLKGGACRYLVKTSAPDPPKRIRRKRRRADDDSVIQV